MASVGEQYTDDFEVLGVLGKGSFGTVLLIEHRKTQDQFARKEVDLSHASDEEKDETLNEVKVMKRALHPHIVSYKYSIFTDDYLHIYTEFCAGGDLKHFITSIDDPSVPEELIVCWLTQMIQALQFLHEERILHRDIKPDNIYLTKDGDIKLGDMGISRILLPSESVASTIAGTPCYMSPEIFSGCGYNDKTDIWSLGCVIYELATKDRAFNGPHFQFLMLQVVSGRTPRIPVTYSKALVALNYNMMLKNPDLRHSAKDILAEEPVKSYLLNPKKPMRILSTIKSTSIVKGQVKNQTKHKKIADGGHRGSFCLPISSLTMDSLDESQKSEIFASTRSSMQTVKGADRTFISKSSSSKSGTKRNKAEKKMPSFESSSVESNDLPDVITTYMSTLYSRQGPTNTSTGLDTDKRRELVLDIIQKLQSICAVGLGEQTLFKAYRLIEQSSSSEDLEKKLQELLKDRFTMYYQYLLYLRIFEAVLNATS